MSVNAPKQIAIADDELLLFVGHSNDAVQAAAAIKGIEGKLLDELRYLDEVSGHASEFRRLKIFEWSQDAQPDVGGQDRLIDPIVDRANIAVFVFQDRVGDVTWDELAKCRKRKIPVIAIFADKPSRTDVWNDPTFLKNWTELLERKKSLTKDWTVASSEALKPVTEFTSLDHLREVAVEEIRLVLPRFVKPLNRLDESPNGTPTSPPAMLPKEYLEILFNDTPVDRRPSSGAVVGDLDESLLSECWGRIREGSIPSSTSEAAAQLGLIAPFPTGKQLVVHRAAVICFARHPERFLPQARSTFIGPQGLSSQKAVFGPLPTQLQTLLKHCRAFCERYEYIDESGLRKTTSDVPIELLRELISNALAHRDYEQGKVEVQVTASYVEVRSPGIFPKGVSWENLIQDYSAGSRPNNPSVALYAYGLGAVEEIGRGFDVIRNYLRQNGNKSIECREIVGSKIIVRVYRREALFGPAGKSPSTLATTGTGESNRWRETVRAIRSPESEPIPSAIENWVREVATLTNPDQIIYCDGSPREGERLLQECVSTGELIPLNQEKLPGCHLHRTAAHDTSWEEHLSFICTERAEDAGPNNNWMSPADARAKLTPLFKGSMRGRSLYVVPFLMGPPGSRFSSVGVYITDSKYLVLSMRIMTRVGNDALKHLETSRSFTKCLHSLGDLSPDRRFVVHFPHENAVWSIGSGNVENALVGVQSAALRLMSWAARKEGWLAENMCIFGMQNPKGEVRYIAAALPQGCGKTSLSMITPPSDFPGWQTWTVGTNIAWMRPSPEGRLWATNPLAGISGLVPGINRSTNPRLTDAISQNTIYTNVALRPDGTPWWEGHDDPPPAEALDWQGRPWTPASSEPAAHRGARYAVRAEWCSSLSPEFENPNGVPIDALLFGGRRQRRVPLIFESRNWQHGVFLAATLSTEKPSSTKIPVLRRDPMAMLAFCGYNMGDYFAHWLEIGKLLEKPPRVFRVNWFRTDGKGKCIWPGFKENFRILKWVRDRCEGGGEAVETPIGYTPTPRAVESESLRLLEHEMHTLLNVDPAEWVDAVLGQEDFLKTYGNHMPNSIWDEHDDLARRIDDQMTTAI